MLNPKTLLAFAWIAVVADQTSAATPSSHTLTIAVVGHPPSGQV